MGPSYGELIQALRRRDVPPSAILEFFFVDIIYVESLRSHFDQVERKLELVSPGAQRLTRERTPRAVLQRETAHAALPPTPTILTKRPLSNIRTDRLAYSVLWRV
jgi:hypothetical protein